jgi:hypothetical protein
MRRRISQVDPVIAEALAPLAARAAAAPAIERGDWQALRERANARFRRLSANVSIPS